MPKINYLITLAAALLLLAGGLAVTGYQVEPGDWPHQGDLNLTNDTEEPPPKDTMPPQWSDLKQSIDLVPPGDIVMLSAVLKDNIKLESAKLQYGIKEGEWNIDSTQALTGKNALVTFRFVMPKYDPNTKVLWLINFSDNSSNTNSTDIKYLNVSDIAPPAILDMKQELNEVALGGANLLSARISDNSGLEYVAFETNESGRFLETRGYNVTGRDKLVSMSWSNASVKGGKSVGWRIFARDAWGNKATSNTMAFKVRGCPICPSNSDWSNCEKAKAGVWQQSQIQYECGAGTDYSCVLHTKTKTCTAGLTREEAKTALDGAGLFINLTRSENKDTTSAELILESAQEAYAAGDFAGAKAKAAEAKTAAESAPTISRPETNYWPYLAVVALVLIAAWMLLKFGKMHLPLAEKFTPPSGPEAAKSGNEQVCGVCGKPFPKLYVCEDCGTKVCFEDARTWQGKIFCVSCLRKDGLL